MQFLLAITVALLLAAPCFGENPNTCDVRYPKDQAWSKFNDAWNPLTRYGHLEFLMERNDPNDIPVFISLLNCFKKVGREGDTVAELVFDHLKAGVPIEFDSANSHRFESDQNHRQEIIYLYEKWWGEFRNTIEYDPTHQLFFPKAVVPEERHKTAAAHNRWYINSHGSHP